MHPAGPGGDLVHGAVLFSVLSHEGAKGRESYSQLHADRGHHHNHAAVCRLRQPLRQDRPSSGVCDRIFARGAAHDSDLQRDDSLRKSRARTSSARRSNHHHRSTRGLLGAIQSTWHIQIHLIVRRRDRRTRQARSQLRYAEFGKRVCRPGQNRRPIDPRLRGRCYGCGGGEGTLRC